MQCLQDAGSVILDLIQDRHDDSRTFYEILNINKETK